MRSSAYLRSTAAALLLLCAAGSARAQGARKALYIPGSGVLTSTPVATTNSYVDLGKTLQDSLATTDFTIELWVKMGATNAVNPAIIANKDWGSGSNTGIVLSYYASTDASSGTAAANTIRFNFKPAAGTRVDYDMAFPAAIAKRWNHIAIVVNRSGSIQGYLNGVATGAAYVPASVNISADAGKTIAGTLPMRLGTDGKAFGYRAPFNGSLDEVRIWKQTRSAAEIREHMCRTLKGTETGLMTYYRMDEASGDTVRNNCVASSGLYNGMIVNGCYRVSSGAPAGDTSVYEYTGSWPAKSLQLGTAARGTFSVDSFGTTGSYLHLYQVNAAPDSVAGLTDYKDNNVSFGVFASGDTFVYYPKYNYSSYATALGYKQTLGFFTKRFLDDPYTWVQKERLRHDTAARLLVVDSVQGTRQFFLANFLTTCNMPAALTAEAAVTTAVLGWTSGGAALWNIEYGAPGFTPGSGTRLAAVNRNPYTLTGLAAATDYEYYVQDSCAGVGRSGWAGPYSFSTKRDLSVFGGGYALHFNGNGVLSGPVQAVNLGGALRDSLAKSDFTIEMWVKVGAPNIGNPPLIADKDYVSGANTGICLTYTASKLWGSTEAHYFRFNLMPAGGTRRDYDMRAVNEYAWNHLAITVDRRGYIKGYVNGVYQVSPELSGTGSIIADSAKTLAGTLPLYLGTDGTGNYRVPFNGDMDEVRIWKKVRTEEEIRAAMCHKLKGSEPGLLAYYRLDEASGSTVLNTAAATMGLLNGTTVNAPDRMISPAPIGDTSLYVYPAAGWSGVSLVMPTADSGSLRVDSLIDTAVTGVHIYRLDQLPASLSGISDPGTTAQYFGVFTAEQEKAQYRVQYDYSGYRHAVANKASLHLYNRPHHAASLWAQLPATNNTAALTYTATAKLGLRHYLLADFTTAACPVPAGIKVDHTDTASAVFTWTSAASGHYVRYGAAGFDLDAAGTDTTYVNNFLADSLASATEYDFYIQDSCGPGSSSAWSGPFTFRTRNACPEPDSVYADSITRTVMVLKWLGEAGASTGYEIAWGISGTFTDPAIGILQTTTVPRHRFTSMRARTAYDFYIRNVCSSRIPYSPWVGPFTFMTDSVDHPGVDVPELQLSGSEIMVYPNPAASQLTVSVGSGSRIQQLQLINGLGRILLCRQYAAAPAASLSVEGLSDGIYYIEALLANGRVERQPVLIRH